MSKPTLVLNAFFLPSAFDWQNGKDEARDPYRVATYVDQARRGASAGIDIFFQADFPGFNRAKNVTGPSRPPFDPFQLAAIIAGQIENIMVMPSISTLLASPFPAARSLASLDRISRGRVGLNLVSSFRSGSGLGLKRTVAGQDRHAQTQEYLDLMRALWCSWPPGANSPDHETGRFVRIDEIRDVAFRGTFYEQESAIDVPPFSERFPALMMPAGSIAGLALAARNADYVFGAAPTLVAARRLRSALHDQARAIGRDPASVQLILGCSADVSDSPSDPPEPDDAALEALLRSLAQDIPKLDFAGLTLDQPMPPLLGDDPDAVLRDLGARASGLYEVARASHGSVRAFLTAILRQGEHAGFTGSADGIAADMARWIEEGGTDGFQFIRGNDFDALCETIVPALKSTRRRLPTGNSFETTVGASIS